VYDRVIGKNASTKVYIVLVYRERNDIYICKFSICKFSELPKFLLCKLRNQNICI
jgi:hypothetical protein